MRFERPFSEQGFTLTELLVAMVIGLIVMAAVYSTYMSQLKSNEITQEVSAVQQNLRAAMYYLEREIRMAGYNPTGATGANKPTFTDISDANDPTDPAITFTKDLDANGTIETNTAEQVTFWRDSGAKELKMKLGTGGDARTLAQNITTLTFSLLNNTGGAALTGANVRSVQITLAGTSSGGHQRQLSGRVLCRNMGL
ncbi:MAG: prepilin-type N-terminal cleavage/methylation domain-containing protein [Pseudomonadota bacterium]